MLTQREFHLLFRTKGLGKFCREGDEGKKLYRSKRVVAGFVLVGGGLFEFLGWFFFSEL